MLKSSFTTRLVLLQTCFLTLSPNQILGSPTAVVLTNNHKPTVTVTSSPILSHDHLTNNDAERDTSNTGGCGRQMIVPSGLHSARQPRIVGGNGTAEGEFPWVVSLRRHGVHHCGGVIVGQRWILTAAHCVQRQGESSFAIRVGEYHLSKAENYSRDYTVERIIVHHNYTRLSKLKTWAQISANPDIALVKTKEDIHWSEHVWPACLPPQGFRGAEGIVVGWGKRAEHDHHFSELQQKARLNIIEGATCERWFREAKRDLVISDKVLCAGKREGGVDACHGDSGSPLLVKNEQTFLVAGIVSTGIGCARPLMPGLYSNVAYYLDWINSTIDKYTTS